MHKLTSIYRSIRTWASEHHDITNIKNKFNEIEQEKNLSSQKEKWMTLLESDCFNRKKKISNEIFNLFMNFEELQSKELKELQTSAQNILNKHDNTYIRHSLGYAVVSLLIFANSGRIHLFGDANNPEISKTKTNLFYLGCIAAMFSSVAASFDRSAVKKTKKDVYNNILSNIKSISQKETRTTIYTNRQEQIPLADQQQETVNIKVIPQANIPNSTESRSQTDQASQLNPSDPEGKDFNSNKNRSKPASQHQRDATK
jgi:hypothetical protein